MTMQALAYELSLERSRQLARVTDQRSATGPSGPRARFRLRLPRPQL